MSRMSPRAWGVLGAAALLGVALLPASVMAAKPEYGINVTKTASVASLPAAGGSVTYTITVENTGTAFFMAVNLSDTDCTIGDPTSGDDGDGKLEEGETWTYSCTVANVVPPHTNTVTVNACHDGSKSECNNANHNASDTASATVAKVTPAPTSGAGGSTLPPTDKISGTSGTSDSLGLVLMALAAALASVLVLMPARARRR